MKMSWTHRFCFVYFFAFKSGLKHTGTSFDSLLKTLSAEGLNSDAEYSRSVCFDLFFIMQYPMAEQCHVARNANRDLY